MNNIKGDKGEPGNNGFQGPRGFQGEIGPRGYRGIAGIKGEKGNNGPSNIHIQNIWKNIPFSNNNEFFESIYNSHFLIFFKNDINELEEYEPYYSASIEIFPKDVKTIGLNYLGYLSVDSESETYKNQFTNNKFLNKTLIIQGFSNNINDIKIKKYAVYTIGKSFLVEGKYVYIDLKYQFSNIDKFSHSESLVIDNYYRITIGDIIPFEGPLFEKSIINEETNTLHLLSNLEINSDKSNESFINIKNGNINTNSLSVNKIHSENNIINIDSNIKINYLENNKNILSINGPIYINEIIELDKPALSILGRTMIKNTSTNQNPIFTVEGTTFLKNNLNQNCLSVEGNTVFNGTNRFINNISNGNDFNVIVDGNLKTDDIYIKNIKSSNNNEIIIDSNLNVNGYIKGMIGNPDNDTFNNTKINSTDSIPNAINKIIKLLNSVAPPPKNITNIEQQNYLGNYYSAINCYNGEETNFVFSGNNLPKLNAGSFNCNYYMNLDFNQFKSRDKNTHEEIYIKEMSEINSNLIIYDLNNNIENKYSIGKHIFKENITNYIEKYTNQNLNICHMNWHTIDCYYSYVADIDFENNSIDYLNNILINSNTKKYRLEINHLYNDGNIDYYPNIYNYFYLDDSYLNTINISGPNNNPIIKIDNSGHSFTPEYISGVPSLNSNHNFNCICIIENVLNLFHPIKIAEIYGDGIETKILYANMSNPPIKYPTQHKNLIFNNIIINIKDNYYHNTNSSTEIEGINIFIKAFSTNGNSTTKKFIKKDGFNNDILFRIDTKSLEPSSKLYSSEKFNLNLVNTTNYSCRISNVYDGANPNFTWNDVSAYESKNSIINTQDLQIIGGLYQYPPNINYALYDPPGPNYSYGNLGLPGDTIDIKQFRYATFYLGRIENKNSIIINLVNDKNLGNNIIISDFKLYVKILAKNNNDNQIDEWINCNLPDNNYQNFNDSSIQARLNLSNSTHNIKFIEFSNKFLSGEIIARIGISRTSSIKIGGIHLTK